MSIHQIKKILKPYLKLSDYYDGNKKLLFDPLCHFLFKRLWSKIENGFLIEASCQEKSLVQQKYNSKITGVPKIGLFHKNLSKSP